MGGEREETQYDNRVIIDIELLQYTYVYQYTRYLYLVGHRVRNRVGPFPKCFASGILKFRNRKFSIIRYS